jgi:hypothetical protein
LSRSSPRKIAKKSELDRIHILQVLRLTQRTGSTTYNSSMSGGPLPRFCGHPLVRWMVYRWNIELTLRKSVSLYSIGIIIQANVRWKIGSEDTVPLNERTHSNAVNDAHNQNDHCYHYED